MTGAIFVSPRSFESSQLSKKLAALDFLQAWCDLNSTVGKTELFSYGLKTDATC